MNSISQSSISGLSRYASPRPLSAQPKGADCSVADGFTQSHDDVSQTQMMKARKVIIAGVAIAGAVLAGTAAAVATAFAGAAVGGVVAAASVWAARSDILPQFSIKETDGMMTKGAKKLSNGVVAGVASAVVGACGASISGVLGPAVAGINGAALGMRAGTVLGQQIYGNIYENKPLNIF